MESTTERRTLGYGHLVQSFEAGMKQQDEWRKRFWEMLCQYQEKREIPKNARIMAAINRFILASKGYDGRPSFNEKGKMIRSSYYLPGWNGYKGGSSIEEFLPFFEKANSFEKRAVSKAICDDAKEEGLSYKPFEIEEFILSLKNQGDEA